MSTDYDVVELQDVPTIASTPNGAEPTRRGRPKGAKTRPKGGTTPESAHVTVAAVESPEIVDPFDVARLKVRLAPGLTTRSKPVTLEVTKPRPDWWIRVHPTDELVMTLLEAKEEGAIDGATYWIDPAIEEEVLHRGWGRAFVVYRSITSLGTEFFWKIPLPQEGRDPTKWTESAILLAGRARTEWIRVVAKKGRYEHEPLEDRDKYDDPVWSTSSLTELNRMAFSSHHIESREHPEILKLRGKKEPKK